MLLVEVDISRGKRYNEVRIMSIEKKKMAWYLARSMQTLELPHGFSKGARVGADLLQVHELLPHLSRQREEC